MPRITLSEAVCTRGDRTVLGPLSLSLQERRIGVVGRNGSGKSTLARLICGLIAPDSGTARINDIDVARNRRQAVNTVGILFQNPDHQIIFPTVIEEIAFGLRQQGASVKAAEAAALETLNQAGRAAWADRSTQALSQGQRRFLCLLAVLAMAQQVLVLDEPFAGLDIPAALKLRRELARLDRQVILITHDPQALTDYDRVIWLEQGRLRLDGPPAQVLPDFNAEMQRLGEADAFADRAP